MATMRIWAIIFDVSIWVILLLPVCVGDDNNMMRTKNTSWKKRLTYKSYIYFWRFRFGMGCHIYYLLLRQFRGQYNTRRQHNEGLRADDDINSRIGWWRQHISAIMREFYNRPPGYLKCLGSLTQLLRGGDLKILHPRLYRSLSRKQQMIVLFVTLCWWDCVRRVRYC